MLFDALGKNARLGEWLTWVSTNPVHAAREEREFIEVCFANLPGNRQKTVLNIASSTDADGVDSLLHELIAHELLRRLGLEPEFRPKLDTRLTPDMTVTIAGKRFIVEVFLTRNPCRTVRPFRDSGLDLPGRFVYTVDHGDRAKKIQERIVEKYRKYVELRRPMIFVVFLGDHHMEMVNVEQALYGAALSDGRLRNDFPKGLMNFLKESGRRNVPSLPPAGALLPDDNNQPGCPRLSALLSCDWFDTLNRSNPGKRIHCVAFHHWKPEILIPAGRFGKFAEVFWEVRSSGAYEYTINNSLNVVAKFTGAENLEFRQYSPEEPW